MSYLLVFLLGVPALLVWGLLIVAVVQYVESKRYARKLRRH